MVAPTKEHEMINATNGATQQNLVSLENGAIEVEVHRWTIDASQLGLRPGACPRILQTVLGNGRPFLFVRTNEMGWVFEQELGCLTLRVWND
jgi:hypothetical protein